MIARLLELLRHIPSTLARMGGYWGGVIVALLRRRRPEPTDPEIEEGTNNG